MVTYFNHGAGIILGIVRLITCTAVAFKHKTKMIKFCNSACKGPDMKFLPEYLLEKKCAALAPPYNNFLNTEKPKNKVP